MPDICQNAVAQDRRRGRRLVRYQRPARAHPGSDLEPPLRGQGLPREPQRRGSARAQGLCLGRRASRAGRSRDPHRAGAIHSGRVGTLRQSRHQGGGDPVVRLCRRAGRSWSAHAGRDRRDRAALRHGGERTQHRRLRQYRSRALPDLLTGDGQEGRRHPPGARARQGPSLGDLAKRRRRLCLLRPRALAQPRLPPHRHHRQRSRARCRRRARLHARRRRHRRLPAAARRT